MWGNIKWFQLRDYFSAQHLRRSFFIKLWCSAETLTQFYTLTLLCTVHGTCAFIGIQCIMHSIFGWYRDRGVFLTYTPNEYELLLCFIKSTDLSMKFNLYLFAAPAYSFYSFSFQFLNKIDSLSRVLYQWFTFYSLYLFVCLSLCFMPSCA